MSGIAGILHLDGAPVDRDVLERLAEFQKFRGPDAQHLWIDGNVGFAHALLRTNDDSAHERQPFELGDNIWIAANARVDGRPDLIAKLMVAGPDARGGRDSVQGRVVNLVITGWPSELP
jgi:asparagine synthase (glutamine-hydrolysing)